MRGVSWARLGATDGFPAPEVFRARPGLPRGGSHSRLVSLLDQPVEVRAQDPHAATDANRGQGALVDPVPDGLLVQLQHLRDLGHGQKGLLRRGVIQGNLL